MTYLIGFSGPPRSGKDSIANELARILSAKHGFAVQLVAFSTPMRLAAYAMLGRPYDEQHYDLHKDDPQEAFGGKSIRQAMIALTEHHVKPTYGHDFWARAAFRTMWETPPKVLIVTDFGFQVEVDVAEEPGRFHRAAYPQIVRPGTDFSRDSRDYVGASGKTTSIINDDDVPTAANRLYDRLVNQFHMDFG
jgi:hypothetical protein